MKKTLLNLAVFTLGMCACVGWSSYAKARSQRLDVERLKADTPIAERLFSQIFAGAVRYRWDPLPVPLDADGTVMYTRTGKAELPDGQVVDLQILGNERGRGTFGLDARIADPNVALDIHDDMSQDDARKVGLSSRFIKLFGPKIISRDGKKLDGFDVFIQWSPSQVWIMLEPREFAD